MKTFTLKSFNASLSSVGSKLAKGIAVTAMLAITITISAADFTNYWYVNSNNSQIYVYGNGYTFENDVFQFNFNGCGEITITDIKPYIENDGVKMYFANVYADVNRLFMSDLKINLHNFSEYSVLVIPQGCLQADDGSTNEFDIKLSLWNISVFEQFDIVNNRVVDNFSVYSSSRTIECGIANVMVINPRNECMIYQDGWYMDGPLFCDPGTYNMIFDIALSTTDPISGWMVSKIVSISRYIELDGCSPYFYVEQIKDDEGNVNELAVTFPESQMVMHSWEGSNAYLQHDDTRKIVYLMPGTSEGNTLYFTVNESLEDSGTYTLFIPENNMYYMEGMHSVANNKEMSNQFDVGEIQTAGIDDIEVETADELYDVYNAQGIKVASKVDARSAQSTLAKGVYLLKGYKQTKKLLVP